MNSRRESKDQSERGGDVVVPERRPRNSSLTVFVTPVAE